MKQGRGDHVEFRLLGPLEVARDGRVLAVGGRRQRALLKLLLLSANKVVPRDRLIDSLWGERPPETATNALQVAVHALRKLLGSDRIVTQGSGYLIRVEPGELDLQRFRGLVERARDEPPAGAAETLRGALALARGPALVELGEGAFADSERARLEELYLAALEDRIAADLALGRQAELLPELEALVAAHPYRERLRREHMLSLYRSGRQADALEAYQEARRTLVDDLGIEPGPELQELERAILRQDSALALPSARARSNIPAPLTPLIGRRLELAALTSLVRAGQARLLTLTGPGGTGKTRLALESAWELVSDFTDGVFFVDLAPIADPELVADQILAALEVDEQPDRPVVATLKEALRGRRILLLLDNFEAVLDAGPLVTELLAAAPELKALVTSRVVLHVSGEHEYPVPPLALPDLERERVESLARNEAVELFAARARAVNPAFALTEANTRVVAAICVALDGLPLAIELAAARTRELTPEEMLERLGARLDLLTAGRATRRRDSGRSAPRSTGASSCSPPTSSGSSRGSPSSPEVPPSRRRSPSAALTAACWKRSSARACSAGRRPTPPRLASPCSRRSGEYALERLEGHGEAEELHARHARHVHVLAERSAAELRAGQPSSEVYARLEADFDNIRAALRWADTAAPELMLQIAGLLKLFWRVRGHLDEGRRWLESALGTTAPRQPPAEPARSRRPVPLPSVAANMRRPRRTGRKASRSGGLSATRKASPAHSAISRARSTWRATRSTRFRCTRRAQSFSAASGSTTSSAPSSRTSGSV